ncbi:hypothetical protein ACWGB8_29760 [Kitasatospora sp. NPDC054939]
MVTPSREAPGARVSAATAESLSELRVSAGFCPATADCITSDLPGNCRTAEAVASASPLVNADNATTRKVINAITEPMSAKRPLAKRTSRMAMDMASILGSPVRPHIRNRMGPAASFEVAAISIERCTRLLVKMPGYRVCTLEA